jgi:hypothetical protein
MWLGSRLRDTPRTMSGSGVPETDPRRTGAHRVGTLLSVNVGMLKDVSWQGRTVFTGVFKDPVTGPRRVRKLNVDGDGQGDLAGHGGEQRAVFVYQIDSYRYWKRELGRDDFVYGQFGENFTVDGLSDDEVCIGDRYGIGTATFEVTQPRVTCPLMALDPPSTLPRGQECTAPSLAACGTVRYAQSTEVPQRRSHSAGWDISAGPRAAPASSSKTRQSGSCDSRAASTHPAVPPPTTM